MCEIAWMDIDIHQTCIVYESNVCYVGSGNGDVFVRWTPQPALTRLATASFETVRVSLLFFCSPQVRGRVAVWNFLIFQTAYCFCFGIFAKEKCQTTRACLWHSTRHAGYGLLRFAKSMKGKNFLNSSRIWEFFFSSMNAFSLDVGES